MKINNVGISIKGNISTSNFQNMSNIKSNKVDEKPKITQKKSINYNPKEYTNALTKASKPIRVRTVLRNIGGKIAKLEQCKNNSNYNEKEVEIALQHLKKIAECAKMKISNLKKEEQMLEQVEEKAKRDIKAAKVEKKKYEKITKANRELEKKKMDDADKEYYEEKAKIDSENIMAGAEMDFNMQNMINMTSHPNDMVDSTVIDSVATNIGVDLTL